MAPRLAQIKLAVSVLRMVLDLPTHLDIIEVIQSPEDSVRGVVSLVVRGPYCPEVEQGGPLRELSLVYRRVDTYGAELEQIIGLDT